MFKPKRFLSLLLAVIITLTMLPSNAFAEGMLTNGVDIPLTSSENEAGDARLITDYTITDTIYENNTDFELESPEETTASGAALEIQAFASDANALQTAIDNASGTLTLTQNYDIDGTVTINKNLTIDGNGYKISAAAAATAFETVSNQSMPTGLSYMFIVTGGTVKFTNITVDATDKVGLSCMIVNGSTAKAVIADDTTVTGGNPNGLAASGGANVCSGALEMTGGVITGNGNAFGGGGVYVATGATFNMSGGSIENNTATLAGGGVIVKGTFNMSGGQINGNAADGTALGYTGMGMGGGINIDNGTVTITGGSVTNNEAASEGGGVYFYGTGTLSIGNSANPIVITENKLLSNTDNNVCLSTGRTITMTGKPATGSQIGVYVQDMPTTGQKRTIALGNGYTPVDSDKYFFNSDKPTTAGVNFDSNTIVLQGGFTPPITTEFPTMEFGAIETISASQYKFSAPSIVGKNPANTAGSGYMIVTVDSGTALVGNLPASITNLTSGITVGGKNTDKSSATATTKIVLNFGAGTTYGDILTAFSNMTFTKSTGNQTVNVVIVLGNALANGKTSIRKYGDKYYLFTGYKNYGADPMGIKPLFNMVTLTEAQNAAASVNGTLVESNKLAVATMFKEFIVYGGAPGMYFMTYFSLGEVFQSSDQNGSNAFLQTPTLNAYGTLHSEPGVIVEYTDLSKADVTLYINQNRTVASSDLTVPCNIDITLGMNMSLDNGSGALQQTVSGAISDIKIKADTGYTLPASVSIGNGLTYMRNADLVTATISGTPSADVTFTSFPAATINQYTITITLASNMTGSDGTLSQTVDYNTAILPITITANTGYILPVTATVGGGLTYERNADLITATISGNLTSAVTVTIPNATPVTVSGTSNIKANGNGEIIVNPTDSAYKYVLADPDGKVVETKAGNPNGSAVTFTDLMPGQKYTVVAIPSATTDPTAETNKPSGITETDITIPSAGTNVSSSIDNNASPATASITVNPSSDKVKYAVADLSGNKVKGWTDGTRNSITFDDLTPGTRYKVVTTPIGNSNPDDNNLTTGSTVITPPTAVAATRRKSATSDKDKITFPTETGKEYAVVEKDGTIPVIGGEWTEGNDSDRTVDNLDALKTYEVLVRVKATADEKAFSNSTEVMPLLIVTGIVADGDGHITLTSAVTGKKYVAVDTANTVGATENGSGNAITLTGLMPGQKYTVYEINNSETTPNLGDQVNYTDKNSADAVIPAVDISMDGNVVADADANGKVKLTINPSSAKVKYAVTNGGVVDANGWKDGGSAVTFSDLEPNTDYKIVTAPIDGTLTAGEGAIDIHTHTPINPNAIKRTKSATAGKDKIVLNPTVAATMEYAVVPKGATLTTADWKPGVGASDLVFDNLEPATTYEVHTRTKTNSMPTKPILVYPLISSADITGETSGNPATSTIVINPTDVNLQYGLLSADGTQAKGWESPSDGIVTFSDLDPAKEYKIVTKPTDDDVNPADIGGGMAVITAPESVIAAREKSAATDKDKITFPTVSSNEYAVYEKDGTTPVTDGSWTDGSNGSRTVDNLNIDKEYEVRVRVKNTDASKTVLESITNVPILITLMADINAKTGDGYITVKDSRQGKYYVLLDPDGKFVETKSGSSIDFDFIGLMPGQKYTVYALINNPNLNVGDTPMPTNEKDEVTIPDVGNNAAAKLVNVTPITAAIVINPSTSKVKYAVVDPSGNVVATKSGNGSTIEFTGLSPGTEYEIITVPKDAADPTGNQKGKGTKVKTPSASFKDVNPDDAKRDGDNKTITINPAQPGQEYALIDPTTGEIVEAWKLGTGTPSTVSFTGLDPEKAYEVITRETGTPMILPGIGVTVLPGLPAGKPSPSGSTFTGYDTSITVNPTDFGTWYAVVDPVTGKITDDGWKKGTGSTLTFDDNGDGLNPAKEYKIVTQSGAAKPTVSEPIGGGTSVITAPLSVTDIWRETVEPATTPETDKITFNTDADKEYAVVKKGKTLGSADWFIGGETGNGTIKDGDGNDLSFSKTNGTATVTGLGCEEEYEVLVRVKDPETGAERLISSTEVPTLSAFTGKYIPGTPATASITIETTKNGKKYALTDPATGAVKGSGWVNGTDGQAKIITGLEPGKEYKLVVVGTDENPDDAALKAMNGRKAVTPIAPVDPNSIKTTSTTIIINPTNANQSYALVDPGTSEIVMVSSGTTSGWQNGDSGNKAITFDKLTPGKTYEVVTIQNPMPGTTTLKDVVYRPGTPAVTKFSNVTGAYDSTTGKSSITVKPTDTNTKYAVVDKDGNVVGGWQTGSGIGGNTFTDLTPGEEYKVIGLPIANPDSGYPVGGQKETSGVKIIAPIAPVNANIKTGYDSLTVSPANKDYEYALIGPNSELLTNDWKNNPNGGAVTFYGLDSGVTYEVVVRPIATSANKDAERAYARPGTFAATGFKTITGTINGSTASITVYPASKDMKYAVVDGSGSVAGGWQTGTYDKAVGTGGELTFTGLTPGADYKVISVPVTVTTSPQSGTLGVKMVAPPPNAGLTTDKTSRSITVKGSNAESEYTIVDPVSGKAVTSWTKSNGNDLTFSGLVPNKAYDIVSRKQGTDSTKTYVSAVAATVTTDAEAQTYTAIIGDTTFTGAQGYTFEIPAAPSSGSGLFRGWNDGRKMYQPGDIYSMPSRNVTFNAVWQQLYTIGGTIYENDGNSGKASGFDGAKTILTQGANKIGEVTTPGSTGRAGGFSFTNVPDGIYNIIVETPKGRTITQQVVVNGGNPSVSEIILPVGKTNSIVEVIGRNTPPIVVGNLDKQFISGVTLSDDDNDVLSGEGVVELKFIAAQQEEDFVLPSEKNDIQEQNPGMTVALYFDFTIEKKVTKWDAVTADLSGESTVTQLSDVPTLLEILLPLPSELQGKSSYSVTYVHGGSPIKLFTDYNADGYFQENKEGNRTVSITLYAKNFSTYAIAYSDNAQIPVIDTQPQVKSIYVGESTTLSVDASVTDDGELSYQWYSNTTNSTTGGTPISGATSASYNPATSSTGTVYYYVVVTNTNDDVSDNKTASITSDIVAVTVSNRSTGGGSGSSSSGGSTTKRDDSNSNNNIIITAQDNGKVTTVPANPVKDDKVTITLTPDKGYALDKLTITDANRKAISFTDNGDGTYTYTQPDGVVTITATFKQIIDKDDTVKDNSDVSALLNTKDHKSFVNGVGDNKFAPDKNMTRAEAAQMFYNLLLDKNIGITKNFPDVTDDAWYAEAVNTLASLGIITGYPDGAFHPNDMITRAQFATIVVRFAKVSPGDKRFDDVFETHWAYDYINTAANFNWVSGVGNGKFEPDRNITRAEAVTLINRMLKREADKAYVNSSTNLIHFTDVDPKHWAYYQIMESANAHDYLKTENGESWK